MTRTRIVALAGRPNAGKTSVLMHLTGSAQRPVNFPGTTVERNESSVQVDGLRLRIVDLPGIVSLQPLSRDEAVGIEFLRGQTDGTAPELLCAVLDATRLPIELRLLQELRTLGRPLVVAMTKLDVAAAEGRPVAVDRLQQALGLPLLAVNALTGAGVDELRRALAGELPPPAAGVQPVEPQLADGAQPPPVGHRTRTDRIDAVLLHPLLGPLLLLGVLMAMFQLVFRVAAPFMGWIESAQALLADAIAGRLAPGPWRSFIVDGLVNGLGSVLVFVPQIALLIAFVTVLESSGYMARAVFLLDRLLRKIGLTGRSFVPLTSSFACAIPGILSSRIIHDERDRIATIVVAPLMSCSARLPVYVVMLAAFFPPQQAGLLLFLLYLLGPTTAALVATLLRRTTLRGGRSLLTMELPAYQRPGLRATLSQVWFAVREFLVTAGTVILAATMIVWLLGYFPRPQALADRFAAARAALPADATVEAHARLDAEEQAAYLEQSWLASLGKAIQPVFAPAGFDWRLTVGVLAAFPARELVVPTLGTLHSLGAVEADADAADPGLTYALKHAVDERGRPAMDALVALALMTFFALCSQCAGTLAAIYRETHSWRWPAFTFVYMTVLAWVGSVLVYQIGTLLGLGSGS